MCNESFQTDNSTSVTEEALRWYMHCLCHETFGTIFFLVMTVSFLFIGMPLHCYSVWLFLHGNIKPNVIFPLNITIIELLFCIQNLTNLIFVNYLLIPGFKVILLLTGVCWTVRPLLQIFMCTEHYLAVIHPLTFLRYKSIHYRIALALAAWIVGLGNGVRLIFLEIYIFPDHIFFLLFWCAVTNTSFCCVSVLQALNRSGPGNRNNLPTEKGRRIKTDRGRAIENQQKRKAFRTISHILLSIFCSNVPLVAAYLMIITKMTKDEYLCNMFPFCLSITLVAIITTPLIRMYDEGHLKPITCFRE